jgi:hypothetical protein
MRFVWRKLGVLVLVGVAAVSGYGQDQATSQPPSDQQATTQTQSYVFPSDKERFKRYISDMIGPWRLVRTGAAAGIAQWRDAPEEWGQGMNGYGKRFASGMGQNAIQQTVTYGLDAAMGLDTGFVKSKREGFGPRFKDALIQNVTSRKKNGDRFVSVPRFAGIYTGAIVARETWFPERYSYKDGLRNGTTTLLTGFGMNLIREFVIRR